MKEKILLCLEMGLEMFFDKLDFFYEKNQENENNWNNWIKEKLDKKSINCLDTIALSSIVNRLRCIDPIPRIKLIRLINGISKDEAKSKKILYMVLIQKDPQELTSLIRDNKVEEIMRKFDSLGIDRYKRLDVINPSPRGFPISPYVDALKETLEESLASANPTSYGPLGITNWDKPITTKETQTAGPFFSTKSKKLNKVSPLRA